MMFHSKAHPRILLAVSFLFFQRKLLMVPCKVKTGPSTWRSATSLMRQRKGKVADTARAGDVICVLGRVH